MGSLHRQNTLSKQTSAVFNMTLDELQASMGSGRPFGSMNMVLVCVYATVVSLGTLSRHKLTSSLTGSGRVHPDRLGQGAWFAQYTTLI